MGHWQEIWHGDGARRVWGVPDRQVVDVVRAWRSAGTTHRVLDFGCGAGRHACQLAREGFEVYGCDPSESAITACRQRLDSEGLHAELWRGALDDAPYPDGFFDAVVAFNSVYHGMAVRVEETVRLLHRKLRTGGSCFATLPSRDNRMYGKGQMSGADTFVSPGLFHRLFDDEGERGVLHHFSSEEEVRWFFRGFRIASLGHEELALARPPQGGGDPAWFRIPKAYFWRVLAVSDGRVPGAGTRPAEAL